MTRVGVIDHGAGNLVSIANAIERLGHTPTIVSTPTSLEGMDTVILPGVGATAPAMQQLKRTGLDTSLREWNGPLLGICVGFQLLFDTSEEGPSQEDSQACFGFIPGVVREVSGRPLPHIGWNDVSNNGDPIFHGIPSGETFYFVHSFAPVPDNASSIVATTVHGETFVAAARSGQRVGVQFHPERSGVAGARLLSNFLATTAAVNRAA